MQKRESEWVTATRQQITQASFCQDQRSFFRARYDKIYQAKLGASNDGILGQLGKCEDKLKQLLTNFNGVLTGSSEGTFEALKNDLESCQEATDSLIKDFSNPEGNSTLVKAFKQVRKELDARLPSKRQRTSPGLPQETGRAQKPWSNGEISTLMYGVLRLGELEFSDLMNQTLFLKREHELKNKSKNETVVAVIPEKATRTASEVAQKWNEIKLLRTMDIDRKRGSTDTKLMTERDWMLASLLALNHQKSKD